MLRGIKDPQKRRRTLWTIAAGMTVLVFAIVAAFFFKQYQEVKNNPDATAKATSKRILEKVSKIYFLPSEEPTVAQIEDKEKLASQSFFSGAENGDYLLVYPEAKLALLYREDVNKLVNVGPVNTDQAEQSAGSDVAGEQTKQGQ